MKRIFLLVTALLLAAGPASSGSLTLTGVGGPAGGGGGGSLSLDGTPQTVNNSLGTLTTGTLTTSVGTGIIVVAISSNASSVTSITAVGLTFTQQSTIQGGTGGGSGNYSYVWTAPYSTNFSGTITIVMSSAAYTTAVAFGVGNANTLDGSPVTIAGTPTNSDTFSSSISTSSANDFVFTVCAPQNNMNSTAGSIQSAATLLLGTDYANVQYNIVSGTLTSVFPSIANGGGGYWAAIIIAIK
jgi:hypothetical protein